MIEEQTGAFEVDKDGVIARFYGRAVQDLEETAKQGRAIFVEQPFVTIRCPGDHLSVADELVREHHQKRWPKGWAAFCAKQEGLAGGTPIEQWPLLTLAQVAELRHNGVRSVEQLAGTADSKLGAVLHQDAWKLRERARQWLKSAGEVEQELRATVAKLEADNAALSARLERLIEDVAKQAPAPTNGKAKPERSARA